MIFGAIAKDPFLDSNSKTTITSKKKDKSKDKSKSKTLVILIKSIKKYIALDPNNKGFKKKKKSKEVLESSI